MAHKARHNKRLRWPKNPGKHIPRYLTIYTKPRKITNFTDTPYQRLRWVFTTKSICVILSCNANVRLFATFSQIQLCCKYLEINTCTQLFLGTTLSPTVQLHTANADTTPSFFQNTNSKYDQGLRCKHLWHPGVSTVFLEYSTTQHTKTAHWGMRYWSS